LEVLEWRDHPSSLLPEPLTEPPDGNALPYEVPANQAPQILDFAAEQVGNGLFVFTGRVVDENPAGLVVVFDGDCPTMQGQTVVVQSDGTFSFVVRLRTDGTDVGFVTATTTDAQGAVSNEAAVFVTPTPPPA
jgi:hypothetical protein